jgi:hypothetical protein
VSRGSGEAGEGKPAAQLPEPGRFWIRYVPRHWGEPERLWVNLAAGSLGDWRKGARSRSEAIPDLADAPLDDVLYLPPVPSLSAAARDELARARLVSGAPVLIQLFPDEETSVPPASGAAFVFDLLQALLERDLEAMRRLPSGAAAVWPLLPGLTDDPALWDEGCRGLAAAGVRCVQALAPVLEPADRRRLAEQWGGEGAFDALFHGPAPAERDFARVAGKYGLEPFLLRPLPREPAAIASNRWIGGVVALAAELWLRLGRPVEQGQALYRAARWIDRSPYSLEALAREGNLAVLPLDPLSREIVAECATAGESQRMARLLEEYAAPGKTDTDESRMTVDAQTVET